MNETDKKIIVVSWQPCEGFGWLFLIWRKKPILNYFVILNWGSLISYLGDYIF